MEISCIDWVAKMWKYPLLLELQLARIKKGDLVWIKQKATKMYSLHYEEIALHSNRLILNHYVLND